MLVEGDTVIVVVLVFVHSCQVREGVRALEDVRGR